MLTSTFITADWAAGIKQKTVALVPDGGSLAEHDNHSYQTVYAACCTWLLFGGPGLAARRQTGERERTTRPYRPPVLTHVCKTRWVPPERLQASPLRRTAGSLLTSAESSRTPY